MMLCEVLYVNTGTSVRPLASHSIVYNRNLHVSFVLCNAKWFITELS